MYARVHFFDDGRHTDAGVSLYLYRNIGFYIDVLTRYASI